MQVAEEKRISATIRFRGLLCPAYLLTLLTSISIWFLAVRAPLWLDETGSYWMISSGLHRIWANRITDLIFPAYYYLLWAWTRIFGHSEVILRSFSILAMLAAAWFLYLAAGELFNRSRAAALAAAVLFCIHPITIYEAVDIRPYAFVALAASLSIWLLLRLRHSDSLWLAALFGVSVALPVWFHTLAATILPALLIAFFLVKSTSRRNLWRQFAVALAAFTLAFLPLVPGILYLFRTSGAHVFESPPTLLALYRTLAPGWQPFVYIAIALVALVVAALASPKTPPQPEPQPTFSPSRSLLICAALGLIPVFILYGVSTATTIHCFIARHRMVSIPGIALCWAWLVSRFRPRILQPIFCLVFVALTAFQYWISPVAGQHNLSWKYALQVVQAAAAPTHSPVLICSDYPESNSAQLPSGPANNSRFLAQLSYYKLTVPAYVMPRALNSQAMQIGSSFIRQAAQKHERFFAVAYQPSYPTLDWLSVQASSSFHVRVLGIFDKIKVLEFTPAQPPNPRQTPPKTLSSPLRH